VFYNFIIGVLCDCSVTVSKESSNYFYAKQDLIKPFYLRFILAKKGEQG